MLRRGTCLLALLAIGPTSALAHEGHDAPPLLDDRPLGPNLQARIRQQELAGAASAVWPLFLVDGASGLPANEVKIEVRDGFRYIMSNGIPAHETGKFPNRNNPNSIAPQHQSLKVPLEPKPVAKPMALQAQPFGVAVNGVLFDPGTAEYWRNDRQLNWRMEAIGGPRNLGLDPQMGHVQPSGAYHYHALPPALMGADRKASASAKPTAMTLIGWAADGYPIYGSAAYAKADDTQSGLRSMKSSYRLKKEVRPGGEEGPGGTPDGGYTRDWEYVAGAGDLDECNGRTGVTPEFPKGTYYYVASTDWPFIPRMFHGTPDPSFERKGPGPGGPGGRPGGPRGPGGPGGGGPDGQGQGPRGLRGAGPDGRPGRPPDDANDADDRPFPPPRRP